MTSIRSFLIIVLLSTITVVNSAAVYFGYRNSMEEANSLFDDRLDDVAQVLAATPRGSYQTVTGYSSLVFQVWLNNELIGASRNAPTTPITDGTAGFSNVKFDGFGWRAFTLESEDTGRLIIVAESTDIRFEVADNIVLASVLPILSGLPVIGLIIWLAVGRGLQPVNLLAREMGEKRSDNLSTVEDIEIPGELDPLVRSINELLARLQSAIERERGFAADAAHELRTPISVLKLQLHNLLEEARGDDSQLRQLQQSASRLERSVEQVLMLYRMTPEQYSARFEVLDLTELTREAIATLYPLLRNKGQNIEMDGDKALIKGDPTALTTLIINLIENASRYSGDNGEIRVTVSPTADAIALTVEDNGPGIEAEQREKVFERFYRGQHDTSVAGTGIGLAIVSSVAEIHGASISLDSSGFATGLAVTVTFSKAIDTEAAGPA